FGGEPVWYRERAGHSGGTGGQDAGDDRGEGGGPGLRDALHDGAVVGGAFGEQGGDVVPGGVVVGAQVPAGQRLVRRVGVGIGAGAGRGAVGRADPGQDLVSGRPGHGRPPLVRAHQARNDSGGGAGAPLAPVQPPAAAAAA